VITALLTLIREPETIAFRPPLASLLDKLDPGQLRQLVDGLLQITPEITEEVERLANALVDSAAKGEEDPASAGKATSPASSSAPAGLTPLEATLLRRQIVTEVANSIRDGYDSWGEEAWYDSDLSAGLQPGLIRVQGFLDADQPKAALDLLALITEAWEEGCNQIDDYFLEYFDDNESVELITLGNLWAEALLTGDLSPEEREEWADLLDEYAGQVLWGSCLEVGAEAARQGWDYPPLQAVLNGQITQKGVWEDWEEDEAPYYADDLAKVRIGILEKRGEYQAALYLAEAEGRYSDYLRILILLGRVEEGVEEAKQHLESVESIHTLARTLAEAEEFEHAFDLARHGLGLENERTWLVSNKAPLAVWLRDLALARQDQALALWAARQSLTHQCNLTNYETIQRIAGEEWPVIKPDILSDIANRGNRDGVVDIYLSEGMHDDAIAVVDKADWFSNIERVLAAVQATHPEWAFRQCARRADAIMNEGRAKDYDTAAAWVRQGRDILLAAGMDPLWNDYIDSRMATHARKYKLMPMLRALVE
jgi:uncharacterized Zn finger protein